LYVSKIWAECDISFDLAGGLITVEGPFSEAEPEANHAVTGGTDAYKTAHGELHIVATNEALEFTFHLVL
jgi:hypothetical protein